MDGWRKISKLNSMIDSKEHPTYSKVCKYQKIISHGTLLHIRSKAERFVFHSVTKLYLKHYLNAFPDIPHRLGEGRIDHYSMYLKLDKNQPDVFNLQYTSTFVPYERFVDLISKEVLYSREHIPDPKDFFYVIPSTPVDTVIVDSRNVEMQSYIYEILLSSSVKSRRYR